MWPQPGPGHLTTEYMPLSLAVPAVRNPKLHATPDLVASIRRFGFVEPVLLDGRTGRLIAGHGRLEALRSMEASGGVPPAGVLADSVGWLLPVVKGWSSTNDVEAEALLVAVNQLPAKGGWDDSLLAGMLEGLPSLEGTGFTGPDLDAMLAALSPVEETVTPEKSYDERGDQYRNAQVRSMVFDYPLEDYEAVLAAATEARARFGVESNAELFEVMLRSWAQANP